MHRLMRKEHSQVHPRQREQHMPRSCGRKSTVRTRGLAWGSECEERGGGAGGGLGKEVGSSLSRHHTHVKGVVVIQRATGSLWRLLGWQGWEKKT